jgi:hypothetical protein
MNGVPLVLLYEEDATTPWRLVNVTTVGRVEAWPERRFSRRELPAEYGLITH